MNLSTKKMTEIVLPVGREILKSTDRTQGYAPFIAVSKGSQGEIRLVSKHGRDSFRFMCTDEYSGKVRRIGDASILSQDGRRPLYLLAPGTWSISAYNETRGFFEKVTRRFIPSDKNAGKFLLEVTSGSSADNETRVVFEVRLTREEKRGSLFGFQKMFPLLAKEGRY